jgi:hypothetical protein
MREGRGRRGGSISTDFIHRIRILSRYSFERRGIGGGRKVHKVIPESVLPSCCVLWSELKAFFASPHAKSRGVVAVTDRDIDL